MAIEVHVFLKQAEIPSLEQWQGAITEYGFPCTLNSGFKPLCDTGFVTASYGGTDAGFEFYLGSSNPILDSYFHLSESVADRDTCATFRFGGNIHEMSAALSAAAVLTKLSAGLCFYPDDDILYKDDEVIQAIRAELTP